MVLHSVNMRVALVPGQGRQGRQGREQQVAAGQQNSRTEPFSLETNGLLPCNKSNPIHITFPKDELSPRPSWILCVIVKWNHLRVVGVGSNLRCHNKERMY